MGASCPEVLEKRKAEFEKAKKEVDPEVVTTIMKGLPVERNLTPQESELKHAWVAYHECM